MPCTEIVRGLRVPVADGFKSDGEARGVSWALFCPPLSDNELEDYMEAGGWQSPCSYSGGPFAHPPVSKSSRSYTLIRQVSGLDI